MNRDDARGRHRRACAALLHGCQLRLDDREALLLAAQLHRNGLLLLTQAVQHRHVGVDLVGQVAHVRLLLGEQLLLEREQALLALAQLLRQHFRGVGRDVGLCAGVLFDEDVGETIRNRARALGCRVHEVQVEAVNSCAVVGTPDWLRHVNHGAAPQPADRFFDRLFRADALFAHDALENGAAEKLLRNRPLTFRRIEGADAAQKLGGQRRRGDADLRDGLVRAGQEQGEQHADQRADCERHEEPELPPPQHRHVIEGMELTLFHLLDPHGL